MEVNVFDSKKGTKTNIQLNFDFFTSWKIGAPEKNLEYWGF